MGADCTGGDVGSRVADHQQPPKALPHKVESAVQAGVAHQFGPLIPLEDFQPCRTRDEQCVCRGTTGVGSGVQGLTYPLLHRPGGSAHNTGGWQNPLRLRRSLVWCKLTRQRVRLGVLRSWPVCEQKLKAIVPGENLATLHSVGRPGCCGQSKPQLAVWPLPASAPIPGGPEPRPRLPKS